MSVLKLPASAIGTVFASRVLPAAAKLVWEKHVYLDTNPEGCRMSTENMGMLLGLTPETVEQFRRRLIRLGLLYRGEGRPVRWYVSFPHGYLPAPARPKAQEYAEAARHFDEYLHGLGGWNPNEHTAPTRTGVRHETPISSPASLRGEGVGGGVPQSPSLHKGSPQSAIQDGGVIHSGSGNCDGGTEIPSMKEALRELGARLDG